MQKATRQLQKTWMVDYGPARDRAIGWLGRRYLLATPVNRVAAMEVPRSGYGVNGHKEYRNEV